MMISGDKVDNHMISVCNHESVLCSIMPPVAGGLQG